MRILFKTLLIIFVAAMMTWSFVIEPNFLLESEEVEMKVEKFPESLGELRVLLFADMHMGMFPNDYYRFEKIVEAANALNPDIIFLLGDFFNGGQFYSKMNVSDCANFLKRLKSKYGIYGIYGNHDSYADPILATHAMKKAGVKILCDSSVLVKTPKGNFYVAGIMDPRTMPYSIPRALENVPEGAPCVLLSHSPRIYFEIPQSVSVTFAGHTHGGQIHFPFFGPITANSGLGLDFAEGRVNKNGSEIYITSGVGTSRLPARFLCPPKLTLVKLSGSLKRN